MNFGDTLSMGDILAAAPVVYTQRAPKLRRPTAAPERSIAAPLSSIYVDAGETSELILGWRAWRPGIDVLDGKTLRSVTIETQWTGRDIVGRCMKPQWRGDLDNTARCTAHLASFTVRTKRPCACGIHTLRDVQRLPAYAQPQMMKGSGQRPFIISQPYIVIGAVAVFGVVVDTELGWLSDRARIEALYLCPPRSYAMRDPAGNPFGDVRYYITKEMECDAEKYRRQFGVSVTVCTQEQLEGVE